MTESAVTPKDELATPDQQHPQGNECVVQLKDLVFQYDKSSPSVLDIPEWQLMAGERTFLFGKSGSGKSTLLNLLSGTLSPGSGEIQLFEQSFSALSSRKRDKFRAQHIGVVFQQFNLIPYLSVRENIQTAAWFAGNKKQGLRDKIQHLVDQLKLPQSLLDRSAGHLSVGQQQRVAIARALVNDPGLLIVDEPTSALDADARDSFMQLLLACCDEVKSTLIFVSHDQALSQFFNASVSLNDINLAAPKIATSNNAEQAA